jgi:hypothetical protein
MEKFEKVLRLFIKNRYSNIELSEDFKSIFKKILFVSSIAIFTYSLVFFITQLEVNYIKDNSLLPLYYFFSLSPYVAFFILFVFIKNYFHIKYLRVTFAFFSAALASILFISILLAPLSLLFTIDNIGSSTIYAYYISFAFIVLYYYFYYYKKWKQYILHNHYEKIKKRLKSNNYYFDIDDKLFQFNLNEDEKDKPKLTKIAEIVVSFMMRFGFTLPILAVLASSGTGGNGMIYFAIYLMFFIIPEIMKMLSQATSQVAILKQIEKEENVTIYNGRIKY